MVPIHQGASTKYRWPKARRSTRDLLSRLHWVAQLCVRETAYGFSRSDSGINSTSHQMDGIRGGVSYKERFKGILIQDFYILLNELFEGQKYLAK